MPVFIFVKLAETYLKRISSLHESEQGETSSLIIIQRRKFALAWSLTVAPLKMQSGRLFWLFVYALLAAGSSIEQSRTIGQSERPY